MTWTTSACTGSLILGAVEILSGSKQQLHWSAFDRLEAQAAQIALEYDSEPPFEKTALPELLQAFQER